MHPKLPFGTGHIICPPCSDAFDLIDAPARAYAPGVSAVEDAMAHPIGSDALEDVARGASRVHLVVPDATRPAGTPVLVDAALRALERAGVGVERTGVVFGLGLHRPPTQSECRDLLGCWADRLEVIPCEPDSADDRRDLGLTSLGTPIFLGRRATDADCLVLIGSIDFHYFAGFTGGRKAVLPGLAAAETIHRNHLRVLGEEGADRDPRVGPGLLDGNPVHLDMEEAAARVGPGFIINSVTNGRGEIVRVFAGEWRRAHRAGCEWMADHRRLQVREPRPLVIASAGGHPKDINLIQAHKAMEHVQAAVAAGGVLVLAAECRDGMGHPSFLPWFEHRHDLSSFRERLRRQYEGYGQTAYALTAKLQRMCVILVSKLAAEQVEATGMIAAQDMDHALRLARARIGETPGWWVPHAGSVLLQVA